MSALDPAPIDDCELCQADRFTHWYHADEIGWIADCEVCSVPMMVWNDHGIDPPEEIVRHLVDRLTEAADARFGPGNWKLDRTMRQIPDHFHGHARDHDWWSKRFSRPMSRYTGVGGERTEHPMVGGGNP